MHPARAGRFQWSRALSTFQGGSENAYKILGLQRDCTAENVRVAFRELAKATHPDKQSTLSGTKSSAKFVRVLAAYQILADPRRRALYDTQLRAQEKFQREKEEFYQRQKSYQRKGSSDKKDEFDQRVGHSEANGWPSDHTARHSQPANQEFICPETEVVEWLRQYRSTVTSAVHRRELSAGGGLLEHVRGEFGSALRTAYHGPPVSEELGIPACFEADERAQPHVTDILQLVSGHNLFGFVRVIEQPLLESLQSPTEAFDGRTGGSGTFSYINNCSHIEFSDLRTPGHQGHSRSIHDHRQGTGDIAVGSEYADLELQVFGKVIARATRVQRKIYSSNGCEPFMRDCVSVYSISGQGSSADSADTEDEQRTNSTLWTTGGSSLIGTIYGLGEINPTRVCAVHSSDGRLTHRIVQHQLPLVKHMAWYKDSGLCECRCRRASLLPSRYWIFAPRSTTHNVGGWYIESWSNKANHRNLQSAEVGESKYGTVDLSDEKDPRLHPAMYILAAAYKTLDEEATRQQKLSLDSKFMKFRAIFSTFALWCKDKLKLQ